jgi:hypothetical protein
MTWTWTLNFIEQRSDTMQCNMRYNIKYHTENDNCVIDGRKQYDDAILLCIVP